MRASLLTTLFVLSLTALLTGCPPSPCCTADADCGDGRMCVDAVCSIPCASDDGCRENEVCAATRSSEGSGRFCVRPGGYPSGTCPNPALPDAGGATDAGDDDAGQSCAEDAFEPNDDRPSATALAGDTVAIRSLSLCTGDEDWFVVDLLPGESARVDIAFLNADGDLDLYAFADGIDTPLATSTSTGDDESVSLSAPVGGRFFIQVFGWNGSTNPSYGLSFTRDGVGPCVDGNEPNETLTTATVLPDVESFGSIAAGICTADDVDVYRVDHTVGDSLSVQLAYALTTGGLLFRVLDSLGNTVVVSSADPVGQSAVTTPLVVPPHFIEVRGANGSVGPYALSWSHPAGSCGNGIISPPETCDDGNVVDGDGCSSDCVRELPLGWTCSLLNYLDSSCHCGCGAFDQGCVSLAASACEIVLCPPGSIVVEDDNTRCNLPGCGDGVLAPPAEECDDGNLVAGDGCSASCQREPLCGDGFTEPALEQCDDGNLVNGDGCSGACILEFPLCGNGILDPGEFCDDGDTQSGDGCSSTCVIESPVCGNGILNPGEQCDDGNLTSGDGCSASCTLEAFLCGNGTLNIGEQCDDGNLLEGDGCSSTCTIEMVPLCGNGVLNPGEQCDDGNLVAGDGCSPLCTLEFVPVCGNGVPEPGEQCDDGNLVPGDGCSPQCTFEGMFQCGNGVLEPGEQCDDGNFTSGDGCSPFCSDEFPPTCGDGFLNDFEQCDDGNNVAGDGCSPFCTEEVPPTWTCPPWYYDSGGGCDCGCGTVDLDCESPSAQFCDYNNCPNGASVVANDNSRCELPLCGNGIVNPPTEQCDDGNLAGGDGCSSSCQTEIVCGNGIVEGFEQCDDGNLTGGDGCTPACTIEFGACGNGIVEPPFEQCDDGNLFDGDGCSSFCIVEFAVCGNGVIEPPFEQCDDGNLFDGDGCSSFCTNEAPVGWTCPVFWYGDNLCDCGCAVLDVDCPSLQSSVCEFNNCPGGEPPVPNNNPQCELLSCGDGTVQPPEQCDDGNLVNGDGCNLNCLLEPVCGNGFVEGLEQCDDGNNASGDGCSSSCVFEPGQCGNGIVEPPFEQCDDGNFIDGDGCSSFCFFEFNICGNGIVEEPFEQCDDGNTTDGDGCSSFCSLEGPDEWTCFPEWYGDGICDCGCGVLDVDCPDTTADVCGFVNCQPPQVVDPNDNSQCIDVACADDFFEDNDSPQDAADIDTSTLTNAVLCPDDPDFFVFDAPLNVDVTVALQYTAPPPMTLRVSRPGVGIIETVSGGGGNLVINFTSTQAGPVIVRVTGLSVGAGVPRPYAVTAFVENGGETCIDDALEPNNEPPGTGPLLLPAHVDATSCASDPDFFTFVSGGSDAVGVSLTSPSATALFFAVFSVDFTLLATGTANGGAVTVTLPNPGPFVVVVAGGAGDAYALDVAAN